MFHVEHSRCSTWNMQRAPRHELHAVPREKSKNVSKKISRNDFKDQILKTFEEIGTIALISHGTSGIVPRET